MHGGQHLDVALRVQAEAPGRRWVTSSRIISAARTGSFCSMKKKSPSPSRSGRRGIFAVQDAVGVGYDEPAFVLAEYLGELGHLGRAGVHDLAEEQARPHRGELVRVAHQQQAAGGPHRGGQVGPQPYVDHGGLVHHYKPVLQGLGWPRKKRFSLGLNSSRRCRVKGLHDRWPGPGAWPPGRWARPGPCYRPMRRAMVITALTRVVLPVPGPPVSTPQARLPANPPGRLAWLREGFTASCPEAQATALAARLAG